MRELVEIGEWLRERLPQLTTEHGVPGAVAAVGIGGEVVEAAAGVLSTATGVGTTVDSLFQIGSVTKVLTATLVMQLVGEGRVDLDAPVSSYLPGFRPATVRQLLCHTAGFEGDVFTDTGKGDDCLAKYVDLLAEVVRGKPFDACMREQLFTPLGMTHAANDPYEAIVHRVAVGHHGRTPSPVWAMARSNAPAGSMLAMTARDLVAFCRPWHARKFAARLQAAQQGAAPVLVHVFDGAGHGAATDPQVALAQDTEWLAFLLRSLGLTKSPGLRTDGLRT